MKVPYEDEHETPRNNNGLDPVRITDWVIGLGFFAIVYLLWCLSR